MAAITGPRPLVAAILGAVLPVVVLQGPFMADTSGLRTSYSSHK